MDLGDPRESLVDLSAPGVWEADNRVEERWQWGAQILDLCNLSPEEYKNSTAVTVKSIQDCGECGGGGGDTGGTVTSNEGEATLGNSGDLSISFEKAVATKLYAFVTFKDKNGNEYTATVPVEKGEDTATADVSQYTTASPYSITEVKVGFKEDGSDADDKVKDKKYEYSVSFKENVNGKTYVLSILCTETDKLTGQDYADIIAAQGEGFDYVASYDEVDFVGGDTTAEAIFYAICSYVDHWMPEAEEDEYFAEHSYDFVFLTQKTIDEIKEDFTVDTDNWERDTVEVNGDTYNKWMRRDFSGAQCPYAIEGEDCQDYELPYTLVIKE